MSVFRPVTSVWMIFFTFWILSALELVSAQDCSETKLCATGCCSQYGFCGIGDDFCKTGCKSTCDFKLGCDANNPCKDGTCCSKFGFCGLGPDYCSKEKCVAGCDAKAYCDPGGYGLGFAEVLECPLKVCCSKWGYCGITEEFCGTKKVTRPQCSTNQPLNRVVGYYEGWAARRKCQAFNPEDIPNGVYTHLNFAFAGIDPKTFQIAPASSEDEKLYKRLTALKKRDSNLQVFIAIGGWAFNDPGQGTETVFSQLVADTTKQAIFFQSLVSFMSTYGFDGVDIDWEYPEADDRSGLPADYVNFPKFIANLKSALFLLGHRHSGVSLTLPVSYWYLRHFDIIRLEPHVDFFNVMSYDLHGSWDKANKWIGPYLNSHTNLTEITEYLDLLWRNDIDPAKVTLGLAFYTRHFSAASTSCMQAGCVYASEGPEGPCTANVGVLSNAEIVDLMSTSGAKPTLDRDAAVQTLIIGNQWITYDDAESWKIKTDFARSQCLGGVMVWAVSQDTKDGRFSKELQTTTGYKSVGTIPEISNGVLVTDAAPNWTPNIDQCFWSRCGHTCPSGFTRVDRADPGKRDGEMMYSDNACLQSIRHFCCPLDSVLPTCGWYDFNNGKCGTWSNSKCSGPFGEFDGAGVEVGSLETACNRGWQVACCSASPKDKGDIEAVGLYANCEWQGEYPNCAESTTGSPGSGVSQCKNAGDKSTLLVDAEWGSGAAKCRYTYDLNGVGYGDRPYCCNPPQDNKKWKNCYWQSGEKGSDGQCDGYCPETEVMVAMKSDGCSSGGAAYCCTPVYQPNGKREAEDVAAEALDVLVKAGDKKCFEYAKMGNISTTTTTNYTTAESSLIATRARIMPFEAACYYALKILDAATLSTAGMDERRLAKQAWKSHLVTGFSHLTLDNFLNVTAGLDDNDIKWFNREIVEDRSKWNGVFTNLTSPELSCRLWVQQDDFGEPGLLIDQDDGDIVTGDDEGNPPQDGLTAYNPFSAMLEERGGSRGYKVWTSDRKQQLRIGSVGYPSGEKLLDYNQNADGRYQIKQLTRCLAPDYYLETKARSGDSKQWAAEHILEYQTIARFMEFAMSGQLPTVSRGGGDVEVPSQKTQSPWAVVDWSVIQYLADEEFLSYAKKTYATLMLSQCGSYDYATHMVVCDQFLNGIKGRLWGFQVPVGKTNWRSNYLGTISISKGQRSLYLVQNVLGVFDYLRDPIVVKRHIAAYEAIKQTLAKFEDDYSVFHNSIDYRLQSLWKEYMTEHMRRVMSFTQQWLRKRLVELLDMWESQSPSISDPNFQVEALSLIDRLESYLRRLSGLVFVDTTIYK